MIMHRKARLLRSVFAYYGGDDDDKSETMPTSYGRAHHVNITRFLDGASAGLCSDTISW